MTDLESKQIKSGFTLRKKIFKCLHMLDTHTHIKSTAKEKFK